ncbi:hypothetical protein DPX16_10511 [Anabarilius grahami]|uniref:Uncharacterized protein n=1 Tax=Anabarilius grahami TaxID=495550 RepID=A0A3N0Z813_ANAGA|nr:hypothetical protein DPX16_10511 [Anabarilius grahami]
MTFGDAHELLTVNQKDWLSVIFCPRQDIAHLPSSVGMGVHGRSHHLPHVRSTASIKDEFLCQSIPIPSSIPLCPNYFI